VGGIWIVFGWMGGYGKAINKIRNVKTQSGLGDLFFVLVGGGGLGGRGQHSTPIFIIYFFI